MAEARLNRLVRKRLGPFPALRIEQLTAEAYRFPTEQPESDATAKWDATTLIAVHVSAGGVTGFGYSYGHAAAVRVIQETLSAQVLQQNPMDIPRVFDQLSRAVRNFGREGIAATAISALDIALWDLKARLLGIPLHELLGTRRRNIPLYASGGFTSYSIAQLENQLHGWRAQGFPAAKIKLGSGPQTDLERVRRARAALGADVLLMTDANGAYDAAHAAGLKARLAEFEVTWFEEPVSSNDFDGLSFVRRQPPATVRVTAGEYGWTPLHQLQLLRGGCVDVLQVDVTRCLGVSGLLEASALANAFEIPLSAHTAPSIHARVCAAAPRLEHIEYFHDHVLLEQLCFDGFIAPRHGHIELESTSPGHGLTLRARELEPYRVT